MLKNLVSLNYIDYNINMNITICIILLLFILYMISSKCYIGVKNKNGHYINKNNTENKIELIKEIQKRVEYLIKHVDEKYNGDEKINRLVKYYSGEIDELVTDNENIFAYNQNKGERISVCLENEKGELNDINEIMFVVIHELAHIMTAEYEHNKEFWTCFKFLLSESIEIEVYDYINYNKKNKPFCKQYIHETPLIF